MNDSINHGCGASFCLQNFLYFVDCFCTDIRIEFTSEKFRKMDTNKIPEMIVLSDSLLNL